MRNQKTLTKTANLRRSPVSRACLTFAMTVAAVPAAFAGAGWGVLTNTLNQNEAVRTYYAHSPTGPRTVPVFNAYDPVTGAGTTTDPRAALGTGAALRKFVDTLPQLGLDAARKGNTLAADATASKYMPAAVPSKWTNPNGVLTTDDYYEIAVVEYKEKMHSDLANPTVLRGYVQVYPDTTTTAPTGSVALTYKDGVTPIKFANGNQVYAYDKPHYMGPAIVATKGVAVRMKFYNFLPAGTAGNMPIPVDTTLPGAGLGPDGATTYSQNRAEVHLHGGDTPWISDGTPHQWITPAGELDATVAGSLANQGVTTGFPTAADLPSFIKGVSQQNVPDMPDPGPGAATYYFPNVQSGRLMFYHDHSFGLTRLNVYMGEAAPYVLLDPQQDAILSAALDTSGAKIIPGDLESIPLVLQDKTFVPHDIALQDGMWNNADPLNPSAGDTPPLAVWGGESDLWYPHVYEVNQDPIKSIDGTNPVGRWDWGPYFWPVFPSLYNLPSGAVNDVTLTPEAWMDTPLVNGVAYPTLTVDPTTVRFKILNAANDRMLNLSMFVADSSVTSSDGRTNTEVKMVPAVPPVAAPVAPATLAAGAYVSCVDPSTGVEALPTATAPCWPSTYPTDGRDGGVPDPATFGPAFQQIASEGGLLPEVATIQPSPMGYEYNRRSITVLNTYTYGLFLGNAERADVLVDFSKYRGKTLIMYNDSPAPVPAFDPRNDHWTGKPDETAVGSVETPKAGFGPNTRTFMQIVVRDIAPGIALDAPNGAGTNLDVVKAQLHAAYAATQELPVVSQNYYSGALGAKFNPVAAGTREYATIFTGSLQEPALKFTPGNASGALASLLVANPGDYYQVAPSVTMPAPVGGTAATAKASMRISKVAVTNAGSGYIVAPSVTFTNQAGVVDAASKPYPIEGAGATAVTTLKVVGVNVSVGGTNYTQGDVLTLTFANPTSPLVPTKAKAAGTAVVASVNRGAITRLSNVRITAAGSGYVSAPSISVSGGTGTGAKLISTAGVDAVIMTSPNVNNPALAGGNGYNDLRYVTVAFTAPPTGNTAVAVPFGSVNDVTLTSVGSGYTLPLAVNPVLSAPNTTPPATTIPPATTTTPLAALPAGGTYVTATATAGSTGSLMVKSKAIQELFDPTYGRMNATLGIELPFTSALTQTTIPLGYVDPISEEFNDGETQIWKITHNGVDSHPVHFHLVNVQLINRIGWDGTIKPPQDNERGWKETIKMHPLEDIVVALRAKKPVLPGFGLPLSQRLRDPSQPQGTPAGFTQIDPATGLPATITNEVDNYGWEYVWHCHILGHEENDFMRAVKFNANELIPVAATGVTAVSAANAATTQNGVLVSWTDNALTEYKYVIVRTRATGSAQTTTFNTLANATSFFDATAVAGTSYKYTVQPVGATLPSPTPAASNTVAALAGPATPTALTATSGNLTTGDVTLQFKDNSANESFFLVQRSTNGGASWTTVATPAGNATQATTTVALTAGLIAGANNQFRVIAGQGTVAVPTAYSAPSTVYSVDLTPLVAPSSLTVAVATPGSKNLALGWAVVPGATSYSMQTTVNGGTTWSNAAPVTGNSTSVLPAPIVAGQTFQFRVTANKLLLGNTVSSSTTTSSGFVFPAAPGAMGTVTATVARANGTTTATVSWPVANPAASADTLYTVAYKSATGANSTLPGGNWTTVTTSTGNSVSLTTLPRGNNGNRPYYWFQVTPTNITGSGAAGVSAKVQIQ